MATMNLQEKLVIDCPKLKPTITIVNVNMVLKNLLRLCLNGVSKRTISKEMGKPIRYLLFISHCIAIHFEAIQTKSIK
jgi:hypothetical protein